MRCGRLLFFNGFCTVNNIVYSIVDLPITVHVHEGIPASQSSTMSFCTLQCTQLLLTAYSGLLQHHGCLVDPYDMRCTGMVIIQGHEEETYHANLFIRSELSQEVDVCHLAIITHYIPPHGCNCKVYFQISAAEAFGVFVHVQHINDAASLSALTSTPSSTENDSAYSQCSVKVHSHNV